MKTPSGKVGDNANSPGFNVWKAKKWFLRF
jgi:hypothetical protein